MKKFVMGLIVGGVIAVTGSAYADEIESVIGKTIEGSFPVKISGKQLEVQALVIQGTSYLPVRAIGEALDMDISFDADLGIELNLKGVKGVEDTQKSNSQKQLERSNNINSLSEKLTTLMNQENELYSILFPYENEQRQTDGSFAEKSKDSIYEDAVKKREILLAEKAMIEQQLQDAVNENNEIFKELQKQ